MGRNRMIFVLRYKASLRFEGGLNRLNPRASALAARAVPLVDGIYLWIGPGNVDPEDWGRIPGRLVMQPPRETFIQDSGEGFEVIPIYTGLYVCLRAVGSSVWKLCVVVFINLCALWSYFQSKNASHHQETCITVQFYLD